ncbi:Protein of unknown function [Palleronia salina]|uniref:DUF3833 domain-containing protein n=1 Tax=Palleronia salina TaxID=313368 RepID=A0A1M6K8Y8_9RHOB|nr:DUF3833 family protein [Palleronia salina]SHJ55330.1 Protein of unknown function [Palleronia salina]
MDIFIYISILAVFLLGALILRANFVAFRGQNISDYEGLGPEIDLRRHLDGPLICEGVIFGPTGRVASRFTAAMRGEWEGDRGVLHEDFSYDSGARQSRAWHLELHGDRFIARADDVEGEGKGQVGGPAVRLSYRIVLPKDAGGHRLDVVDWMYLSENGTIINRSQFTKYGFLVAELVATIRKEEE